MKAWGRFSAEHPAAVRWLREGGLFVVVSNLVTAFKYFLLQFLPAAFAGLGDAAFGRPGIPGTLFGETFQWNIQRNFVFRSTQTHRNYEFYQYISGVLIHFDEK